MRASQVEVDTHVSVVIAESNHLNCQLVESAFRTRRNHVAVVASAVGSRETLEMIKEHAPDVAIISSQMESGPLDGYYILRELHSLQTRTRLVLLLGSRDRELVIDAFRCGAHGVVFRDEPLETLAKCIHAVHRGQVWANSLHLGYLLDVLSQLPMRLHDAQGMELLSKREGEVARLVAEGLTNRGISVQLGLSEHTIRNYLFKIFDKLGVSTRVELVLYCFQDQQSRASRPPPAATAAKNGANGTPAT
jgi:two-component system nitrate/nitrite response regulator NarL